jgi:hypothetical protein
MAVVLAALLYMPASPPGDTYRAMMRVAVGALMLTGSLSLAIAIDGTFLRGGGNGAFKALYWASVASSGAGISQAASAFYPMNVMLASALAALPLSGAGLMLLRFHQGGG